MNRLFVVTAHNQGREVVAKDHSATVTIGYDRFRFHEVKPGAVWSFHVVPA